jgi:hypothetical protein
VGSSHTVKEDCIESNPISKVVRISSDTWQNNKAMIANKLYENMAEFTYLEMVITYWMPLWSSGQSSWLQNGDVLCFLWGTNWIYICYVEEGRPPLWSSGQSSSLQVQSSGFGSWSYQIFWEVVGMERGPLSLVSTTEELLGRNSSGFGLEIWEYGCRDPSRWPHGTLYLQNLAPISPTSGGQSVGIVHSRTQTTEFFFLW